VKGLPDLRIKLVIDDGTGAVTGIINREITEKLLGKTLNKIEEEVKKTKEENAIIDEMNNALFAHMINLKGNALGDEYGISIIVKDAKIVDIDIVLESEKIIQELEELQ
jgi:replication factor A1